MLKLRAILCVIYAFFLIGGLDNAWCHGREFFGSVHARRSLLRAFEQRLPAVQVKEVPVAMRAIFQTHEHGRSPKLRPLKTRPELEQPTRRLVIRLVST